MRYRNYKCDGCEKPFESEDDIVVCPECATPQHRECYEKNGCCVNEHLHAEGFQWQGEKLESSEKAEDVSADQSNEKLVCPNCSHKNPAGSIECENCGLKFTIFGFNLAQAAQDEEKKTEAVNAGVQPKIVPPDYAPPFKVGTGEEEEEKPLPKTQEEQLNEFLTHTISNASGFDPEAPTENGEGMRFKGIYPDDMEIDGFSANFMGAFIARDSERYIRKFSKMKGKFSLSFNWAAFFFTPYWFFYRKLTKVGIIFMTLILAVGVIVAPASTEFLEAYTAALSSVDPTDIAAIEAIYTELAAKSAPIMIAGGITFLIHLISGLIANPLYKRYTLKNLGEIKNEPNRSLMLQGIIRRGGVSPALAMISIAAEYIVSFIAGMFL